MKATWFSLLVMLLCGCTQFPQLKEPAPREFPKTRVTYGNLGQLNENDVLVLQTENPELILGDRPFGIWDKMQKCTYSANNDTVILDFGKTVFREPFKVWLSNNSIIGVKYDLDKGTKSIKPFNLANNIAELSLKMDTSLIDQCKMKVDFAFKVNFDVLVAKRYMTANHRIYGCCICTQL